MNSPHSIVKQVVIGLLLLGQAAILQAQKSPADARVLTDTDRQAAQWQHGGAAAL